MTSAESPDNSLQFHYWDIQYAPAYNDASSQFQTGFRGEQENHYRWLVYQGERREAKLVPVYVHHLLGPPAAWDAQIEGPGLKFVCKSDS